MRGPFPLWSSLREAAGERIAIALNFSDVPQFVSLSEAGMSGTLLSTTYMDRDGTIDLAKFELRPDEGIVVQLR